MNFARRIDDESDPSEASAGVVDGPPPVVGVCGSAKPGASTARAVLDVCLDELRRVYPDVRSIDLRDMPLPLFDGRMLDEYEDPHINTIFDLIRNSGALILSVPCYWGGVSGVFKNLVDVLCGPAYRSGSADCVLAGKPVGAIVVGADDTSAELGARGLADILRCTGARMACEPVVVSDPRSNGVRGSLLGEVRILGASVARCALVRQELR